MAKKIKTKEVFLVIKGGDDYYGAYFTLAEAKSAVQDNDFDGALIYRAVQVWESSYPEEPEIEFFERGLEDV